MQEYYVFQTEAEAQACLDYINGSDWFPIVGSINGVPQPNKQTTTKWVEAVEEIGDVWCVPRIHASRLDALGVSGDTRDQFIAAFGQDIRSLQP
jgi:hypothetical protein